MITVCSFSIRFGLPEISPLVTKTGIHRRVACRKQPGTRAASPRRLLPYFGDGLRALQCALALALERTIEHYVDWALAGARWANPENFARGQAHCFDAAPE